MSRTYDSARPAAHEGPERAHPDSPPPGQAPPPGRLRHRAEVPFFVFMVVLNVLIIVAILRAAVVLPFLPEELKDTAVGLTIRSALIALLLLVPVLVVIRETQRASTRGTAVRLSPSQYPDLYETAENFAATLGLRRRPEIYLANGNGALNAFAAQAIGTVPTSPAPGRPGWSCSPRAGTPRTTSTSTSCWNRAGCCGFSGSAWPSCRCRTRSPCVGSSVCSA